jgi:Protein of unknown function (DUF4089)
MEREQVEAYVDAAAAAVDLGIAPEHRDGVVHYVGLAAAMAELVMGFAFGIDDEPAAVFVPIGPQDVGASASTERP